MALFEAYQDISGLLKVLHSTDFPPHDLVNFRNNSTRILLFACMLLARAMRIWGDSIYQRGTVFVGQKWSGGTEFGLTVLDVAILELLSNIIVFSCAIQIQETVTG